MTTADRVVFILTTISAILVAAGLVLMEKKISDLEEKIERLETEAVEFVLPELPPTQPRTAALSF